MQVHLDEIARAIAPGAHAVVLLDQAGWHTTPNLRLPGNITLLPLPPRSPELNPVENLWQFLRQTFLSNRVFETYTAILDAACSAWNAVINTPGASCRSDSATGPAQVSVKGGWYKAVPAGLTATASPSA